MTEQTHPKILRLALRDLVAIENGPLEGLRIYCEAMKWPILAPDGPSSPVMVALRATPG